MTDTNEKWEKEFDERYAENSPFCAELVTEIQSGDLNLRSMKQFIRSLLEEKEKEIDNVDRRNHNLCIVASRLLKRSMEKGREIESIKSESEKEKCKYLDLEGCKIIESFKVSNESLKKQVDGYVNRLVERENDCANCAIGKMEEVNLKLKQLRPKICKDIEYEIDALKFFDEHEKVSRKYLKVILKDVEGRE